MGAIPVIHAILAIVMWLKYVWLGIPMTTQVAWWINALTSMTTALDWMLLLLVVSVLATSIHCLIQYTRTPATCN